MAGMQPLGHPSCRWAGCTGGLRASSSVLLNKPRVRERPAVSCLPGPGGLAVPPALAGRGHSMLLPSCSFLSLLGLAHLSGKTRLEETITTPTPCLLPPACDTVVAPVPGGGAGYQVQHEAREAQSPASGSGPTQLSTGDPAYPCHRQCGWLARKGPSPQWALLSEQDGHKPWPAHQQRRGGALRPKVFALSQWQSREPGQVCGPYTADHPVPRKHMCAEVLAAPLTRVWGPQWQAGVTSVLPVLVLSAWPRTRLGFAFRQLPCVVTSPVSSWSHMALVSCG